MFSCVKKLKLAEVSGVPRLKVFGFAFCSACFFERCSCSWLRKVQLFCTLQLTSQMDSQGSLIFIHYHKLKIKNQHNKKSDWTLYLTSVNLEIHSDVGFLDVHPSLQQEFTSIVAFTTRFEHV